jgi:nitrite reductase/ring-hydroxylating ferredoxin subunit
MATGGGSSTCPTGSSMINAGASSQFPSGTYKVISASGYVLFICHDSGGLFAMDASCPHEGVTLTKRTSDIYCRRHGATFDLNGQHPTSPAFSPLDHYPVCVDGSGNILVDVSRTVSATTRA